MYVVLRDIKRALIVPSDRNIIGGVNGVWTGDL